MYSCTVGNNIDDAMEIFFFSNGVLDRNNTHAIFFFQLSKDFIKICMVTVQFVDEKSSWKFNLIAVVPRLICSNFNSRSCGYNDGCHVHGSHSLNLFSHKIKESGYVYHIELDILIGKWSHRSLE